MSQNVHTRLPPPGLPSGVTGHSSRSIAGVNSGSDNMNHANNSQPALWVHSTNQNAGGGLAGNQQGAAPGTPSAADYDKATTLPSPQSSSGSQGTTLKEHDLLGLSDVSSSSATKQDNSGQRDDFSHDHEGLNLNLNLGATELRLGPQDEKPSSGFLGTSSALDTGSFLGLDAVSKGLDGETAVQDRRSANVDPSAANSEQLQEKGMDRGFSYSSLNGDRASSKQVGQVDMTESSGCRPLIESELLPKWHGAPADLLAANEGRLNMSSLQQQNLRSTTQDDLSEKKLFERKYNEDPQEVIVQHQQYAPADEHQVYSEWRERKQHNVAQDDVSSSERGLAQDQVMAAKANPSDLREGAEVHERMDLEAYPGEKRNFQECNALLALQSPEQRFQQDMSTVPSPRHTDYVVQQKLWQSQISMRPQMGVPEFQNQQQQQMSLPPKDENSRNGLGGNFPGLRAVFAGANKSGVSGAKRPFDTIGTAPDARNFNDSRVSSVSETPSMTNPNSSTSDAEAKAKAQPSAYPPWAGNRAPTWQMLHSGGSFGPFPSQAPSRNQVLSNKPTVDAASAGGEIAPKGWEAHNKSLQQQQEASASVSQKLGSSPSENKPAPAQAPSPPPEASSAPRAPAPTSHAVGWPPLRSYRKNSIAAHPRPSPVETQQVRPLPPPPPPQAASPASVASQPNSCLVKVYMDGVPFGRKVDLKSSNCSYEKLSVVLEGMFRAFVNGQQNPRELTLPSDKRNFLHGSDYVLTYEDQDGDLMLVGDVPWTMFIDTVKRLRIMKGSEAIGAIGLGHRAAEKASKLQPTV